MPQLLRLFRHVRILAGEELRDLLLRKRALFSLILYLIVISAIVVALNYIERKLSPSLGMFRSGNPDNTRMMEEMSKRGWAAQYEVVSLIAQWPSSIIIMQLLSLVWFPTLVALVSCDMIAVDLYRGTLRFVLLRTTRLAYFLSKTVAHFSLYLVLHLITLLALLVVSGVREPGFTLKGYLPPLALYTLVSLPFFLFLVTSTQFISCVSGKPMKAVVRLHLLWIGFLSIMFFLPQASPLHHWVTMGLIAPIKGFQWQTVIGMSAWSIGFLGLGYLIFRRKAL